jgi:enolase
MSAILELYAREALDSRGNLTLEVECGLESGAMGRALVPSGASTGRYGALELRDKGQRFKGKGVRRAVRNVNQVIAKELLGMEALDQCGVDELLFEIDGTEFKTKLGANAILGVSMACARAAADELALPLYSYLGGAQAQIIPVPFLNLINGGAHAPNNLDIQEFMVVPVGFDSFTEALRCGVEVYQTLKEILVKQGLSATVGDEGGFAPNLKQNEEGFELLIAAIEAAGYKPGQEVYLALDAAASELYSHRRYELKLDKKTLNGTGLVELYERWVEHYPICSIEDGLAQEDLRYWRLLTERLGKRVQILGDDIFATNPKRLKIGIEEGLANAILVKPNQIGTLTETLDCIDMARRAGYRVMVSHRSGETEDTFIADLAVAVNAGQIKSGAPCRSERVAKYNQLLRIEEELGGKFLGLKAFK